MIKPFGILNFGDWDLFVICELMLEDFLVQLKLNQLLVYGIFLLDVD